MMFKTQVGPMRMKNLLPIYDQKQPRVFSLILKMSLILFRLNCLLELLKLAKLFVMKLHLVILFSESREFEQMEIEFFVKPGEDEKMARILGRKSLSMVAQTRYLCR